MARPRQDQIAQALGVKIEQVSQLKNRGMPTGTLDKARRWFERHGMSYTARRPHAVHAGGAPHQRPR